MRRRRLPSRQGNPNNLANPAKKSYFPNLGTISVSRASNPRDYDLVMGFWISLKPTVLHNPLGACPHGPPAILLPADPPFERHDRRQRIRAAACRTQTAGFRFAVLLSRLHPGHGRAAGTHSAGGAPGHDGPAPRRD